MLLVKHYFKKVTTLQRCFLTLIRVSSVESSIAFNLLVVELLRKIIKSLLSNTFTYYMSFISRFKLFWSGCCSRKCVPEYEFTLSIHPFKTSMPFLNYVYSRDKVQPIIINV